MVIKEWAEEDRPREKLERLGAEALSNAELLAILIGSGSTEETAVELMKRVLNDVDNDLNRLSKLSLHDLCGYNGIGPAKAITILAATELGKRRQKQDVMERPRLKDSTDIFREIHGDLRDKDVEEAWILLLNFNGRLIRKMRISHGGLTETLVDERMVIKEALLANATGIVLCHNHPSGNSKPSKADDMLTQKLKAACNTMRLSLYDHLVIVEGDYFSYADNGKI